MKIKVITALSFAVLTSIFSCTRPSLSPKQKELLAEYEMIDDLLNDEFEIADSGTAPDQKMAAKTDPPYYGSVVKYKEIQPCLAEYAKVMKEHGIQEDETTPINIKLTRAFKITYAEIFRGKELKKFLLAAARKRRAIFGDSKNLGVNVEFGVYTAGFAATRDKSRIGRIGVFLVTHKYKKDAAGNWRRDNDDNDEDSFDFGGIHP